MPERISMQQEEADFTFGALLYDDIAEKDFDESKHPRDEAGKFSESGGGDGESTGSQADRAPLTSDDKVLLHSYLGSGYRELRTDPEFGKVLEKLPKYSGRVYRGTRATPQEVAKLKVGSTYHIGKYSSSSLRSGVAALFTEAQRHDPQKTVNLMFVIDDNGRKIPKTISEVAGSEEAEIVLMRGDRYRITEIEQGVNEADERPFTMVRMKHIK